MPIDRKPQDISKVDWYYEQPSHLLIVHQVYRNGEYLQTDQFKLPWRMIEKSRARRPKPRKRRS